MRRNLPRDIVDRGGTHLGQAPRIRVRVAGALRGPCATTLSMVHELGVGLLLGELGTVVSVKQHLPLYLGGGWVLWTPGIHTVPRAGRLRVVVGSETGC